MSVDEEMREHLIEAATEAGEIDEQLAGYLVVALVNDTKTGLQGIRVWSAAHCEGCAQKVRLLDGAMKAVATAIAQREGVVEGTKH